MPAFPPDSRRSFLKKSALAGMAASLFPGVRVVGEATAGAAGTVPKAGGPVVISSRNGMKTVERAMELLQSGSDALDAVVAGVNLVEEDPEDTSVGYGGLPNYDGVVELDASVMHGPSGRAGSVASLQGIKYPSKVARLVLQRSDHVLLVGEGAQRFARMHGFPVENLLTDEAREIWLRWRETMSTQDDYLPPHGMSDTNIGARIDEVKRHWGTINCCAIDKAGNISGVTTTSGLAFKIPGRVGDSPIIGAGLYVDNEVGAAGSTGRGEANLENCSSFLIVERMRMGDSPEQACLYACQRIADHTRLARLKNSKGQPDFNVKFYALNKAGQVGGAEIFGGDNDFAVADAQGVRTVKLAYLFRE
jgi:N4-(beta-N-acetylglucosaminyl)-L-asparaginase